MKYCVATKISTTDVHNNELLVESVHSDFDRALEKSTNGQSVIEINDHVKKGDSINSDGELWQSSNEATRAAARGRTAPQVMPMSPSTPSTPSTLNSTPKSTGERHDSSNND